MRTSLGKTRDQARPYAIFEADGWEWRVLKAYQRDPRARYARWYLATRSPYTHGSFELGDGYAADVMAHGRLVYRDPQLGDDEMPGLDRPDLHHLP